MSPSSADHDGADPTDPSASPPPPPPPVDDDAPRLPGAPTLPPVPTLPTASAESPILPPAGSPAAPGAPSQPQPVASDDAVPYLPPVVRPVAEPAPEPVFDAKALVESQKHYNANPAYGAMPKATPESIEAARKLREEAARKRNRNRRLGWYLALAFLGVILTAGYLAFRAYQDEQDSTTDGTVADADAAQTLEALDGSTATTVPVVDPSFLNAVRTSRNRLGTIDAAAAERALDPSTAPVLEYRVVRFDSGADDAAFTQYDITYSTDTDQYVGFVTRSDTREAELIAVDDEWYAVYRKDAQPERFARNATSLDPAGDTLYSQVLEPIDFLPLATQPYTTPVEEQPGPPGHDRRPTTARVALVDSTTFQANDPDGYQRWIDSLVRGLDMDELIEPALRQTSSEALSTDGLSDRDVENMDDFRYSREDGLAIVSLVISAEGDVLFAGLIMPSADLRLTYSLLHAGDEAPTLSTADDWE